MKNVLKFKPLNLVSRNTRCIKLQKDDIIFIYIFWEWLRELLVWYSA